nr:hypothetical protein [Tanacetum cinerariifolium]
MGRDAIQLETAVSTISQEYLLEFTSEYGILEDLHQKLPGPEERIVDFSEGWMSFRKRPGKNTPQCHTKPLDSLNTRIIDSSGWTKEYFSPPWTGAQMLQRMRCQQRTPILGRTWQC